MCSIISTDVAVWYQRLGKNFPRDALLDRDKALIPHLAKNYKVPIHRLHRLAEEVADWRVEDHWLFCQGEKLRWAKNALVAGHLQPREIKSLEADLVKNLVKREREHLVRFETQQDVTHRLFGFQPRIRTNEFLAAVRHLAAQRQAEDDAQRQNQAQLVIELERENDAILDELLALGLSLAEIEELRNG